MTDKTTQHIEKPEDFKPPSNPYNLFKNWLSMAEASEINDPGAMCLATATPDGRPSARMVLLKDVNEKGFKFHTNNESRKGEELKNNSFAALCFHWKTLRKQVRIEGKIIAVSEKESENYYRTRNRQSQIGAWASQQSRPLKQYSDLIQSYDEYQKKFKDEEIIPKPDYWVGFILQPEKFEFWQDGDHRLHQRHLYTKTDDGWDIGMLYP